MSDQNIDYESLHKKLGCYGCKFADKETLGKDACCQHIEGVSVDKDGVCIRRVPLEPELNWKEEIMMKKTGEYAKLEQEKQKAEYILSHDEKLVEARKNRNVLNTEIAAREAAPQHTIFKVSERQAGIRQELADGWGTYGSKTFDCDAGKLTLRTTKSFHIASKKKLVEFLMAINKLPNFIKTFEIAKLRKVKEAGLLDDDVATWDEHDNVTVTLKEKPTVETKEVAEQ